MMPIPYYRRTNSLTLALNSWMLLRNRFTVRYGEGVRSNSLLYLNKLPTKINLCQQPNPRCSLHAVVVQMPIRPQGGENEWENISMLASSLNKRGPALSYVCKILEKHHKGKAQLQYR